ncbi:MAG: LON peptidase substrate-binding domain-containing protein, partial [Candidatus Yanofskybacteria bacterium]|nr:LON peptidase substrate-binding domain-containing protein [Candidatus Yanofskybacteria bacterium]
MNNILIPEELPLIALKNTVLFPKAVIPLIVQRPKSVSALEYAHLTDRLVFFATQRSTEDDVNKKDIFTVNKKDIFTTGVIGRIISVLKLPDGSSKVDVEGLVRARITEITNEEPFFRIKAAPFSLTVRDSLEEKALLRKAIEQFRMISEVRAFPTILPEIIYMMSQIKDTEHIISLMAVNSGLEIEDQQNVLEMESAIDALRQLNTYLARESELLEAEKKVAKETKKQLGKMQKELFLREQLKSIEKELGVDDEKGEMETIKHKIAAAGMPKEVEEKASKELHRLGKMPPFNPEVSYLRTYLDLMV